MKLSQSAPLGITQYPSPKCHFPWHNGPKVAFNHQSDLNLCFLSFHQFVLWFSISISHTIGYLQSTHTHHFSPAFHTDSMMPGNQRNVQLIINSHTVIFIRAVLPPTHDQLRGDPGCMAWCFHGLPQLGLSHTTMCIDKEASVCD